MLSASGMRAAALSPSSQKPLTAANPPGILRSKPCQLPLLREHNGHAALAGSQALPSAKPHLSSKPSLPSSRIITRAADDAQQLDPLESAVAKITGPKIATATVTLGYVLLWYAMNIGFNLLNKSIFKYFPFPWTVSTVHVVVGLIYCVAVYAMGFKGASFGRKRAHPAEHHPVLAEALPYASCPPTNVAVLYLVVDHVIA
ncbi:hypothetical protein DUNSADRAFT_4880 [Dunaliella salina]|uniref:Sugar phosphate transporter domain-containing protein n=1 Tax=Dunaliella salina TaxID=3046 RepID=A0ABQ7FUK7_DUNSA|nr:hypothetical protein DUNSADRAFT_4880 [Dunaliella salina]|eukprot:KAF5826097.1 hypothetical protein DUNSADRAFT_4880 [Dunaliella salina]